MRATLMELKALSESTAQLLERSDHVLDGLGVMRMHGLSF